MTQTADTKQEDYPIIPDIEIPTRKDPGRSKWAAMGSQLEVGSGFIMPRPRVRAFKEYIRYCYPEYKVKSRKTNPNDPDCNLYTLWREE